MGSLGHQESTIPSPKTSEYGKAAFPSNQSNFEPTNELLLQIPACTVHLMGEGEAVELGNGEFKILRISDENVFLAIIIKVGDDLQWPLTKDEPVVKLDPLNYLFSLPMKDGDPLSYGVTFSEKNCGVLGLLESVLMEHSCFSGLSSSQNKKVDWKEYAPRIEDYNGVLAKAIAGGSGQIVKGIFKCSNAYTNRVQKGGEMILTRPSEEKNGAAARENGNKGVGTTKKSGVSKSLKRVRKLSKMTEKISKAALDRVGVTTRSVMAPLSQSQTGKAVLRMVPGQVLLASLDAVNAILDAVELAGKQALSATSGAATRMVVKRYGETAGEATGDVFATAGHFAGTAWNVFKIRKAIKPASFGSSGLLKNAPKNIKINY